MSEDNKENTLPSENLPSGDGGSNSDVTAMEVVLTATATEASSAAALPSAVNDTTHPESMVTDSTR